jgi:hypothetical protein
MDGSCSVLVHVARCTTPGGPCRLRLPSPVSGQMEPATPMGATIQIRCCYKTPAIPLHWPVCLLLWLLGAEAGSETPMFVGQFANPRRAPRWGLDLSTLSPRKPISMWRHVWG